ncbi:hypothetical protein HQ590_13150 [bacterium]|nr:hypothetical protein [bacterium]
MRILFDIVELELEMICEIDPTRSLRTMSRMPVDRQQVGYLSIADAGEVIQPAHRQAERRWLWKIAVWLMQLQTAKNLFADRPETHDLWLKKQPSGQSVAGDAGCHRAGGRAGTGVKPGGLWRPSGEPNLTGWERVGVLPVRGWLREHHETLPAHAD